MKTATVRKAESQVAQTQWSKFSEKFATFAEQQKSKEEEARLEDALVMLFGFCRKQDRRMTQAAA